MASQSVKINIPTSSFPELGTPADPVSAKDSKLSRADKKDYKDYLSEVAMARPQMSSITQLIKSSSFDSSNVSISLDYEPETSKTYKFMGMDIDEDFNAIIKLPQGHIVVASMFDRDAIIETFNKMNRRMNLDESYIRNLPLDAARKLATGLKTGILYDILEKNKGNVDPKTLSVMFKSIADEIGSANSEKPSFTSIILNLVHVKKDENAAITGDETSDDILAKIVQAIISYWASNVVQKYNTIYSVLANIDIWQDMGKRALGESEMTQRMSQCVQIFDSNGNNLDRTVSISGISINRSLSDNNVWRSSSASGIQTIADNLGNNYSYNVSLDMAEILAGFIDTDNIPDVLSLSGPELQALSVIDSLQYIDEDAAMCAESYDMSDPEQRGLYVKSAIRSYERNFREFKPATHYDVTESLAELVERGDVISKPLVSQSVATDDTEEDIVTSKVEDIEVSINKARLLKVMKMVYKSTNSVLKGF